MLQCTDGNSYVENKISFLMRVIISIINVFALNGLSYILFHMYNQIILKVYEYINNSI